MFELSTVSILIVFFCALLTGVAKTGMPTLGILVAAVMASVFPARESIGVVLPMLITADIIAVTYYRRNVNWKTLFSLVPWVLGGLFSGFIVLFFVEASRPIEIIIGVIVLIMIGIQFSRERWGASWSENIPQSMWFIGIMGTLAGFTTMIGNAAGPIMAVFLLAISLPKHEFIGTGAWFFISVNLIKVPMYVSLGLITIDSLTFNLWLVPVILLGTYAGIKCLPFIPQKIFNTTVLVLAVCGGLRLLIG